MRPSRAPRFQYDTEKHFPRFLIPEPPTLEQICQQAVKLPCSPVLLPRLIAAIRNDRTSLTDLEALIRLDSAMAAGALRIANSAMYGNGTPVADISQALLRLGLHEIFRLATLTSLRRWEQFHEGSLPWSAEAFSRHSYSFAKAAEFLAEKFTAEVDPLVAYSAGLVANIGKLATGYVCAPHFPEISLQAKTIPWLDAERSVLGYSSEDVGYSLLKSWRFSPLLISVLTYRHKPTEAPPEELAFVAVLHAAEAVASAVAPEAGGGFGSGEPKWSFINNYGMSEQVLDLAAADVRRASTRCFTSRRM